MPFTGRGSTGKRGRDAMGGAARNACAAPATVSEIQPPTRTRPKPRAESLCVLLGHGKAGMPAAARPPCAPQRSASPDTGLLHCFRTPRECACPVRPQPALPWPAPACALCGVVQTIGPAGEWGSWVNACASLLRPPIPPAFSLFSLLSQIGRAHV